MKKQVIESKAVSQKTSAKKTIKPAKPTADSSKITTLFAPAPAAPRPVQNLVDMINQKDPETGLLTDAAAKARLQRLREADPTRYAALATVGNVAKKQASAPAPTVIPAVAAPYTPATVEQVTKVLGKLGFTVGRKATDKKTGAVGHGFIRMADGAAALWLVAKDGTTLWALKGLDFEKTATSVETLVLNIQVNPVKPIGPDVAPHIAQAVQALGGVTKMRFVLSALKDDNEHYGTRMRLLKKLLAKDKVLASETAYPAFVKAWGTAVGAASPSEFTTRCKEIANAAAQVARFLKKEEREKIDRYLRDTLHERLVADKVIKQPTESPKGRITTGLVKKTKEVIADSGPATSQDTAWGQGVLRNGHLATVTEPAPAVGDEVAIDPAGIALIEHRDSGVVMLRLQPIGVNGAAPCVYNNGREVSLGWLTPDRLTKFREIKGADILKATSELLHPIVPSVKINPAASSRLTAVLNCKELIPVAKFEAPAKSAAKKSTTATAEAPAKKTAAKKAAPAKKAAAKAERAPRATADRKIKALIKAKDVTAKEGSFCYAEIMAAIGSKTVSEAQAKLTADKKNPNPERRIEIAWMVKKGFISVSE